MPGLGRGGIEPGLGRLPEGAPPPPPPRGPGAGRFSPGRAARSPPGAPWPPGRGPGAGRDGGAPAPTPNGLLPTRGARGPGLGDCRLGGTTWPPPCLPSPCWLPVGCWVAPVGWVVLVGWLFCAAAGCCSWCGGVGGASTGFGAGLGPAGRGASVSTFAAAGADVGAAGTDCAAGFGAAGPGLTPGFGTTVCATGWVTSGLLGVAAGLGCVGVGLGVLRASDFAEPPALGYASRNLRATGASTVEDADFTNSPSSLSFERTSLLVTPSSFASSCTRALPATALLVRVRPAARARATSSYCLTFMASASRLTHDGSTCFRSSSPVREDPVPVVR
jgi:hypothetical protein